MVLPPELELAGLLELVSVVPLLGVLELVSVVPLSCVLELVSVVPLLGVLELVSDVPLSCVLEDETGGVSICPQEISPTSTSMHKINAKILFILYSLLL